MISWQPRTRRRSGRRPLHPIAFAVIGLAVLMAAQAIAILILT